MQINDGGTRYGKGFFDEMIEALNELRLAEEQRVYDAVKNKELPPKTMKPSTVMKTVFQVALNHQVTGEELQGMMGMMTMTGPQMQAMQQTADALEENE